MQFKRALGPLVIAAVATCVAATAPAVAVPRPAATAAPTLTRITINHTAITLGQTAVVSGYVAPRLSGHTVYLESYLDSAWHVIARYRLPSDSRYSFAITPRRVSTYALRVYSPAVPNAARLSLSPTVRLAAHALVTPKTSVAISRSSVTVGSTAVVSGSVAPNRSGGVAYLESHLNSAWRIIDQYRLGGSSRYSFSVRPGRVTTYVLRVYVPGASNVRSSLSRTVTLTSRPAAAQNCTPGYTPCIPPGPDVDCAGGSGNGPRYVQGPVYVTGSDPYGLDRDGDGVACEDS